MSVTTQKRTPHKPPTHASDHYERHRGLLAPRRRGSARREREAPRAPCPVRTFVVLGLIANELGEERLLEELARELLLRVVVRGVLEGTALRHKAKEHRSRQSGENPNDKKRTCKKTGKRTEAT